MRRCKKNDPFDKLRATEKQDRLYEIPVRIAKRNIRKRQREEFVPVNISAVLVEGGKPLWAKVSPDCPDIVATAGAAGEAGAEAVVVANTYTATSVDWRERRPRIAFGTGGLSGPAVRPLTLYKVALVSSRTDLPVIASGGAFSAEDVLQLISVGASAVQVGTVNLVDPAGACRIPEELIRLLTDEGIKSVRELIGCTDIFSR